MASIGCYLNTRNGRNTLGAKVTICMQEQSNWPTNSMNQIQGSQLGFRSILRKRSSPPWITGSAVQVMAAEGLLQPKLNNVQRIAILIAKERPGYCIE